MTKSKVFKLAGVIVSLMGVIVACIATLVTPFFEYDDNLRYVAGKLGVDMNGMLLDQQGGVIIVGSVIGMAVMGLLAVLMGKAIAAIVIGMLEVGFAMYCSSIFAATLAEYSKWVSNGVGITLVMLSGILVFAGGIIGLIGNIMKKREANQQTV